MARISTPIWEKIGNYIKPKLGAVLGLLLPDDGYINFGATSGEDGYGLREKDGNIEFKTSGGSWAILGSGGGGSGDMLKSVYDPTTVEGDAFDMDNMVEGTTNKLLTASEKTILGNTSGTNTGDQDISGISTNASAITDIETKTDFISVTQAVDLDQMETDIAALANGMVYKGAWDASAGTFPASADTGFFYTVSVAGTVDSIEFAVDDRLIAITDSASTTVYAGNWTKVDATDAVQSVVGLTGNISKSGLLSALNVEDGADETDTANVTLAGALMDSEVTNLAQVKAFDTTDYATSAQGTLADSALQSADVGTIATQNANAVNIDGGAIDDTPIGATTPSTGKFTITTTPVIKGTLTTDTDGATITFDKNVSDFHNVVMAGNRTLALSNMAVGDRIVLRLTQDATGTRVPTFFTTIKWAGGTAPTLTTTANKADIFGFLCTSSGNYDGFVIGQNI